MPALKYVRGEFLGFMREVLESRACRDRGLYSRAYVDMLAVGAEMHHPASGKQVVASGTAGVLAAA